MLYHLSFRFNHETRLKTIAVVTPHPEKPKMKTSSYCIFLPLLFLFGCTTVQDFREMTPEQRAKTVCEEEATVKRLKNERNDMAWNIESAQEEMLRGYTFDEGCQPFASSGNFDNNPGPYCDNFTMPANPGTQKQELENWKATLNRLDNELQVARSSCYSRVVNMTPQEAYKFYCGDN